MAKPFRHPADFDAIRGIHRGLDGMKAGTDKPFRAALDEIRIRHKIPRNLHVRRRIKL
jgi:hypothetical protein